MIEEIRDKYLLSRSQIVVLNALGQVVESDNQLFDLELNVAIGEFHAFFYIVADLLKQKNTETVFSGVHINDSHSSKVVDVIVNSGSENSNPFIVIIDFSIYYKNFQSIAQEKNESILSFHLEELKTKQLQVEKAFKDKFLANVSHDLKTPIWGTAFFVNKLQQTELNEVQSDYVHTIKESNTHIYHLVNDLLDLSKIELGQMSIEKEAFDFSQSMRHLNAIFEPKALEKKLKFILEIDKDIPTMLIGDAIRLNQILINLLDNSIKFTTSGSVFLGVQLLSKKNTCLSVQFSVKDTGFGIETSNKLDVFQSFRKLHSSKKIEGLGLGLSIVSNLVELMNGSIDFQTELNKGTVFQLILPFEV